MSTSGLSSEGPRTQQSLATNVTLASKAPLEEKRISSPRSTYLPRLVAVLAERSISGPWHLKEMNLSASGSFRASGGFFDIFDDASDIVTQSIYRRVGALVARQIAK